MVAVGQVGDWCGGAVKAVWSTVHRGAVALGSQGLARSDVDALGEVYHGSHG